MKKLLPLLALMGCAAVQAAGTDELWEMTTTMEMGGMKMPGQTSKTCMPKAASADTGKEAMPDPSCQILESSSNGGTSRMKFKCTGKMAMEGTMENTRTADTMKMVQTTLMGKDTMKSTTIGKRVGTCDAAGEMKKMKEEGDAAKANACKTGAEHAIKYGGQESKMPKMWSNPKDCAASKPQLCEGARNFIAKGSYAEYGTYAKTKGWVAGECGINLEARRGELCKKAITEKKNDFIKEYCPVEAQAFADEFAKNCKGFGRDYTADLARPNAKQCMALRVWDPKATGKTK